MPFPNGGLYTDYRKAILIKFVLRLLSSRSLGIVLSAMTVTAQSNKIPFRMSEGIVDILRRYLNDVMDFLCRSSAMLTKILVSSQDAFTNITPHSAVVKGFRK